MTPFGAAAERERRNVAKSRARSFASFWPFVLAKVSAKEHRVAGGRGKRRSGKGEGIKPGPTIGRIW